MSLPTRSLSLFDVTSLIVGIIVGAGIYQMAPDVAKGVDGVWGLLGIWALGGALSLCGALCYAELATAYPEQGGDYVYLNKAYGDWAGFLFGWVQLVVVRPGDIAVMAFAFAIYAEAITAALMGGHSPVGAPNYAVGAVVVLTAVNVTGVRQGAWTQNLLTVAKTVGLLLVVAAAFASTAAPPAAGPAERIPFGLALIFVLFTYGGWNEMAYVAAEVRDPDRNIGRALVLGMLAVSGLYLLANAAFLVALGHGGMAASTAIATDTVAAVFPEGAALLVGALICLSALGAVNGLVFTGARISYALGRDHRLFARLGQWHPQLGTPVAALTIQGVIAIGLIATLGSFVGAVLYTAAAVYAFYLATTLAVIVLRRRDPQRPRAFRVPGYPVTPLVFAGTCALLIWSAVDYKPVISAATFGLVLLGLPVWWWGRRARRG
jgi:APA family basic amino acid/polyamine antiporter